MTRPSTLAGFVFLFSKCFVYPTYGLSGNVSQTSEDIRPNLTRHVVPVILPVKQIPLPPPPAIEHMRVLSQTESNQTQVVSQEPIPRRPIFVTAPPAIVPIREIIVNTEFQPLDFTSNTSLSYKLAEWSNHVCGQRGVCLKEIPFQCEISNFKCQPCKCDSDCFRFRDCCLDMYPEKSDLPPSEELPCVTGSLKANQDLSSKRYYMVNSCPMEYTSDGDDNLPLCERDPSVSEPVYSPETDKNYKNKHCASCNGIKMMVKWSLQPVCRTDLNYSYIDTPDAFLQEALYNSQCDVLYVPPNNSTDRECLTEDSLISTCPEDDQTSPDNAFGCKRFLAPIKAFEKWYRNIFCATCNGEVFPRSVTEGCDSPREFLSAERLQPISTILQETRVEESSSSCPGDKVFDPFENACRTLFCPAGKVVVNHICQDLFQTTSGLGFKVHFVLRADSFHKYPPVHDLPRKVINGYTEFTDSLFSYIKNDFKRIDLALAYTNSDMRILNLTVTIFFVVKVPLPTDHLVNSLVNFVTHGWYFYLENYQLLITFRSNWLPEESKDAMMSESTFGRTIGNDVTIEWVSFEGRGDGPMGPNYLGQQSPQFLPITEISGCKQIQLEPGEFEEIPNEKITIKSSGEVLEYGQFVRGVGDTVRVCTDFNGNKRPLPERDPKHSLYSPVQQPNSSPQNRTGTIIILCIALCHLMGVFS